MSRRGSYELPIRGEVRGKPLLRAPRVEKVCHGISAGNCNERHSRQSMEDSSDEVYKMRFTADLFAKTFHYPPAMVSLAIECGLESEWKMLATEIWVLRCFLPQRHGAAEPQPNAEFPRRSRSCGTEGGKEGIFWTGCTGLTGWRKKCARRAETFKVCYAEAWCFFLSFRDPPRHRASGGVCFPDSHPLKTAKSRNLHNWSLVCIVAAF